MQLTSFLLLTGALGAVAHPSAHAHRRFHRRDDPTDLPHVKAVHHLPIPAESKASLSPSPSPAAPQPDLSAASNRHSNSPAPAAPSGGDGAFVQFCPLGGSASANSKAKRVTYDQIMYVGELGTGNGCPWNSNMMLINANQVDKYKYVQEYKNVANEKYQVRCANKMGADGKLTGQFEVPGQNQLVFDLQPGESKYVASMGNTQVACAFAPGTVPKTSHGQFAGNWLEADFENSSNGGWSGADCSSLVAQAYGMHVPGCRVCEPASDRECSTILEGGIGTNAYTIGMEALDGIGLNLPPGKVFLLVEVGFH
ncbi:hypothetical protein QBC34DRAFT_400796 [Podospora aff. communis PSN243]|uniref:Allergen Asp f 4 n=1 Tax=Podospora aff. communis PSN243 TaxID=3040156 RepID=A0AAV9GSH4_9PEZI|nr:hypothetical protein QBC34DRAFT_400796 [Podospora aff. communis PSN243]